MPSFLQEPSLLLHHEKQDTDEKNKTHSQPSLSHLSIFLRSLLLFSFLFVTALLACVFFTRTNPTSAFFHPGAANTHYSSVRLREAREFAHRAASSPQTKADELYPPGVCIVVSPSERRGSHGFQNTVGSLIHGLSDVERQQIHLKLSVLSTSQSLAAEPWLENVVDSFLDSAAEMGEFFGLLSLEAQADLETARTGMEYTELLRSCRATSAEYVLVLNDDVVAMDGWFHRMLAAIEEARAPKSSMYDIVEHNEHSSLRKREAATESDFLYIRLFHDDSHLNWTPAAWPLYLSRTLAVLALEYTLLLLARRVLRPAPFIHLPTSTTCGSRSRTSSYTSHRMLLIYTLVYTPLLVTLFFLSGKPVVLSPGAGIHSNLPAPPTAPHAPGQGLLFPSASADALSLHLAERVATDVEGVLAAYAAERPERVAWTLTPSVMQYVAPRRRNGCGDGRRVRRLGGHAYREKQKHVVGTARAAPGGSRAFEMLRRGELEAEHLAALN